MSLVHELKTQSGPFQSVKRGWKKAEYRFNDRRFSVGDVLWLREWDPGTEGYTGEELRQRVTHMVVGPSFGIPTGYVMMSMEPTQDQHVWMPSGIGKKSGGDRG